MSVKQDHAFTPPPDVRRQEMNLSSPPSTAATSEDIQAELATLRAQTECLLQELQLCQRTANEQQRLIETLAAQLQQAQQQVQQLEQHQSWQQKRLQEQEAALLQEQEQRQELEARWYRQQQENLHLRQLLHTYAPGIDWQQQARLYQQPIPPWSPSAEPQPPPAPPASAKKTTIHLPVFPKS